jgi:hypothetical protein
MMLRVVIALSALTFWLSVAQAANPPAPQAKQVTDVKLVSDPAAPPTAVKIVSAPPAEVKITSLPAPQMTEIKVKEIPTDRWNIGLFFLTAGLVIANFALCVITIWIAKSQRRDTRDSMRIAERMAVAAEESARANMVSAQAAIHDRRVGLEREVSVAAHRLAVQATLTQNIVNELRRILQSNFAFAGQSKDSSSRAKLYDDAQEQRTQQITAISATANEIAGLILAGKSDDELIGHLKIVDGLTAGIEALKEQVRDDLSSARAYLERQQRRQESLHSALDPLQRR